MKLNINRENLVEALRIVNPATGKSTNLPVLGCVLMQAETGKITLTTTDLDVFIRFSVDTDVLDTGSIAVPIKTFIGIISALSDENVLLETGDNNSLQIKAEKSNYKLNTLPGDEFPALPVVESQSTYTVDDFAQVLNKTSFAMSTDLNRFVLNGVNLVFENNLLEAVATDGRRLSLVKKDIVYTDERKQFIIGAFTVSLLEKLAKDSKVSIRIHDSLVYFLIDDKVEIISRLINGQYPSYWNVIPVDQKLIIKLNREELSKAVTRAGLMTDKTNISIELCFNNNLLEIKSSSTSLGDANEKIQINYSGPEFKVSLNHNYFNAVLNRLDCEDVMFGMTDELAPITIRDDCGFLYVLMPVRKN